MSRPKVNILLSGGSIRGAWQAGALEVLLRHNDAAVIGGTSIGAVNALLAGVFSVSSPTWDAVGKKITDYWAATATSPSAVLRERSLLEIAFAIYRKRFTGLVDTTPFAKKLEAVYSKIPRRDLFRCPVWVSRVALESSLGYYAEYGSDKSSEFFDFTLASTAVPVEMPSIQVDGANCVDGGVKDFIPDISMHLLPSCPTVVIATLPTRLGPVGEGYNSGNVQHLISRTLRVMTHNLMLKQLDVLRRQLDYVLIAPPEEILLSERSFTSEDIHAAITQGKVNAEDCLPPILKGGVA